MKKVKGREFHGLRHSSEYNTWQGIRQRCNNQSSKSYKSYGGRGITVCERWNGSFVAFFEDMGRKPSPKHSIERIDNYAGYSPENCRWALAEDQSNNRRSNKNIIIGGTTKSLASWARDTGVPSQIILNRLLNGWPEEKAVFTPVGKVLVYKGISGTLTSLSREFGFDANTVRQRIKKLGWPIERAIETPVIFDADGSSLKKFDFGGKSLTLKQWADECGIRYGTLIARLRAGRAFADAVSNKLHSRI